MDVVEDLEYFKQFDIKFATLAIGTHEFDLKIDKTFFTKHNNEEIEDAEVAVSLTVNQKENMSVFDFTVNGKLILICDICLESLEYAFCTEEKLILKTSNEQRRNEDENIVFINPSIQVYNVEQILYEIIYGQIPMRKAHQDVNQSCNKDMINRIKQNSKKQTHELDPRWEALKEIKSIK